jgi:hypothetical protein
VRDGFPKLQMLLLVTLTGASGLLTSILLMHAGLVTMWFRYLAAFGIAYLIFLFFLWLWLRTRADDYDIPDFSGSPSGSGGSEGTNACFSGNGGQFGGGGASGSFDVPSINIPIGDSDRGVGDAVGNALDAVSGADEAAIPLLAVVAALLVIGTVFFSSLYMVYSAPTLFAELLVDGVLSVSLYRKLRGLDTPHWLDTAVRRTVWPFILAAAVVSASGWAMALYVPGAHSIGEVLHAKQSH